MPAQFYLSATQKSSGKTTLSIGISAALRARGLIVQPYKKGPDYIDPAWLTKASGNPTYNLDFNTQSLAEISHCYQQYTPAADVRLVEGNMGLFDGVNPDGSDSNAAMAKSLGLPVVLVVNCQGFSRGIAPLLQGYQHFDDDINYAGIILNRVAGSRHESKLLQSIKNHTDFQVLGSVRNNQQLAISERHLGLIPANEAKQTTDIINRLANTISDSIDLDALINRTSLPFTSSHSPTNKKAQSTIRLGIARDAAFGFYYPDDLTALAAAGAELVFFDTINDDTLPDIDALFSGGGFPETQMQLLAQNKPMMTAIVNAIHAGMPTYAECGGMMYLCESIRWGNQQYAMAGIIPATIEMHSKPQGRGLTIVKETDQMLWQTTSNTKVRAHEFHYAQMTMNKPASFAYSVLRGYGINGEADGIVYRNLLANFIHLRNTESNPWAKRFINFARHKVMS